MLQLPDICLGPFDNTTKAKRCYYAQQHGYRNEPPTCQLPSDQWELQVYFVPNVRLDVAQLVRGWAGTFFYKAIPPAHMVMDNAEEDGRAWPPESSVRVHDTSVIITGTIEINEGGIFIGNLGPGSNIGDLFNNVNSNNTVTTESWTPAMNNCGIYFGDIGPGSNIHNIGNNINSNNTAQKSRCGISIRNITGSNVGNIRNTINSNNKIVTSNH